MMNDNTAIWVILGGYIVMKLIDQLVAKYFSKVDADYVQTKTCGDCKKDTASSYERLKACVDGGFGEIKGILLVVALKAGIEPEQLKGLFLDHK